MSDLPRRCATEKAPDRLDFCSTIGPSTTPEFESATALSFQAHDTKLLRRRYNWHFMIAHGRFYNRQDNSSATIIVVDSSVQAKGVVVAVKTILAPIPGTPVAIGDVPDPVFSQGMVGQGIAIDPPRQVITAVAPISGKIVQMHPHAFAIADDDDFGVLVHLGLDTVKLKGEGFTQLLKVGDVVSAGQAVVEYDVPAIVESGLNPITPVVATNVFDASGITTAVTLGAGAVVGAGTPLYSAEG
jgi:PTS system glucose-specific IIA component